MGRLLLQLNDSVSRKKNKNKQEDREDKKVSLGISKRHNGSQHVWKPIVQHVSLSFAPIPRILMNFSQKFAQCSRQG